ncbi:hypothetical protein COO91_04292 [Nostoc flagelliforme CCNUN1]|uniref:Uncharacterized protein n=1 Tax=Nostoc flagelliforme CCNUN1 TaxID=2038116 RepID=A0A2K8SSC4_9NOSO|nr:hypothetical protein COO91_04292 [Nostoc flagelliforme CCNUN1]
MSESSTFMNVDLSKRKTQLNEFKSIRECFYYGNLRFKKNLRRSSGK